MAFYFFDTSALVTRYTAENGTRWVRALCDPAAGHTIVISQATLAETVATLCRKAREGAISDAERDHLIARFRQHVQNHYNQERLTHAVYTRAGDLCLVHPLRAYDAIQLACALALRERPALVGLGVSPILVCAEKDLRPAAAREGFPVETRRAIPDELSGWRGVRR